MIPDDDKSLDLDWIHAIAPRFAERILWLMTKASEEQQRAALRELRNVTKNTGE